MALAIEARSAYRVHIRRPEDLGIPPWLDSWPSAVIDEDRMIGLVIVPGEFTPAMEFHELRHLERSLVEGVPKIVWSEAAPEQGRNAIMSLDNDLEHLEMLERELATFGNHEYWLDTLGAVVAAAGKLAQLQRIAVTPKMLVADRYFAGTRLSDDLGALVEARGLSDSVVAAKAFYRQNPADKLGLARLIIEQDELPSSFFEVKQFVPSPTATPLF